MPIRRYGEWNVTRSPPLVGVAANWCSPVTLSHSLDLQPFGWHRRMPVRRSEEGTRKFGWWLDFTRSGRGPTGLAALQVRQIGELPPMKLSRSWLGLLLALALWMPRSQASEAPAPVSKAALPGVEFAQAVSAVRNR